MRRDGILLTILTVIAAALIGRSMLATGQSMPSVPPGVPVVVLGTEPDVAPVVRFGALCGAENVWFRLVLANPTDRPVRILGYAAPCGPVGCVHIEGIPAEVPARGCLTLDYWVELTTQIGHLRVNGVFYTDSAASPSVPFSVEGDILDGRKRSSPTRAGETR